MRILLVEDSSNMTEGLQDALIAQRYAVDYVADGREALNFIEVYEYNTILLDMMLPGLSGLELCHRLRQQGNLTPILMLTSRNTSQDKVIALDVGADDSVAKPVNLDELLARVRALLRRGMLRSTPVLTWEQIQLNPTTMAVHYAGRLLSLTPKEYSLLELLLRQPDRIFSRSVILDNLWALQCEIPGEATIKTHMQSLRKKLKALGAPAQLIETVYGVGYRLNPRFGNPIGQTLDAC